MRIESYINDDKVSVKDKLIGTDGDKSNKTKNFSITGISNFILGQLRNSGVVFRFSNGATEGLEVGEPGYFFSEANIVDKPTITKFYFSKDSYFGEELAELFSSVGSNLGDLYLGLSQQDDSANYGFFNVANIVNINDEYFEVEASLRGNMFAKSFVDGKNYSLFFDLASSNEFDIDIIGGIFNLYKNGALHKQVDMSVYLDDTNLARLVSGTVDEFGMATFVRDDESTFQVDFGDFFGGVMPTRTSHLVNDGDGVNPFATTDRSYTKSETDNKDAVIQLQVTKLNGLYLERDEVANRINLKNSEGTVLSWITDTSLDGAGYSIEFDADARTIYILDSQSNVVDSVPLSIVVNDKLDKGGYTAGTAQTLKDEIDALAGQLSSSPVTEVQEFYEGHISGYKYNSTCKWLFNGIYFNKTKELTFDPADVDPAIDRIDMWYADSSGDIGIIKGTPSANPVEPSLTDPNTQIQVKFIIIKGASSGPAEITDITAYKENTQVAGGEYNTSENTGAARIILGSVTTPISETKSIEATALQTFDKFVLTPGAPLPVLGLSALKYQIKNKVGNYSHANPLSVRLIGKRGGRTYTEYMPAAWQFGYNKDNSASIQNVSLPFPVLKITEIDAIEFVNNVSSDEQFGFWIDEIGINEGEDNTGGTGGGVDQAYVDQQDAATLAAANSYTDSKASKYLGTYPTLNALETAHPAPISGSYGYVDAGLDSDAQKYIWDTSDSKFVLGSGGATIDEADIVHKSGAETISGVKTFSASPVVPTPTGDNRAAPKKYVDDAVAAVNNGGNGSTLTSVLSKPIDFQLALADLNNHLLATKDGEQIITIPHDNTLALPIGFRCVVAWRGTGPVKFNEESRVRIHKDTDEILEISKKNNAVELVKEAPNTWGAYGAFKIGETRNAAELSNTDQLKILSVNDVSIESLSWLRVLKTSDTPMFPINSPYWALLSTDHDDQDGGSLEGGIIWGECDDPYLTNFVEKGTIASGFESETPWPITIPSSESGLPDEFFLYYHNQDPSNAITAQFAAGQDTRLITTSGGNEPHLCTWNFRGNPVTLIGTEQHVGYATVHKRGVNDYIMFHYGAGGYKLSTSTDGITFTQQFTLTEIEHNGGVFTVSPQIFPFERNGTLYGFLRYTTADSEITIAVATLDNNRRPVALADIAVYRGARDFSVYIEGNTAYIAAKAGAGNLDNKWPFYATEYDLTNLDA